MRIFLILVFFFLLSCSCIDQKDKFNKEKKYVLKNLKYGPDPFHLMDLYLPAERNEKSPVIILIHGGAWAHGDKSEFYSDYANDFFARGFIVANMNYRLLSENSNCHAMLNDVNSVIDFIIRGAEKYGIYQKQVSILGYSAGGHIALLYGHDCDSLNRVNCVVSFSGPVNLNDEKFKKVVDSVWNSAYIYPLLLGKPFSLNSKEAIACSPIHQLSDKPTFIIHGTEDRVVPFYQALQLKDSLSLKGVRHDLLVINGGGHSFDEHMNDSIHKIVAEWLRNCNGN